MPCPERGKAFLLSGKMDNKHGKYIALAIKEALLGEGRTRTNPLVGCVLVKGGRVISRGFHAAFGKDHAEAMALKKAGKRARGATAYVTLEPCVWFSGKKTRPCAERLAEAGIKKVVIGMRDPNPKVSGKGIEFLRKRGVKVAESGQESACREINAPYIKCVSAGRPLVTIKAAVTLDGNIAASGGDSKWISCLESRRRVHGLRALNDAVMVGVNTVLADDPELSVRLVKGRNPVRIVVDPLLKTPLSAKIAGEGTIIAVSRKAGESRKRAFRNKGVILLTVKMKGGLLDLKDLMLKLPAYGISSVLAEGGSRILTGLMKEKLADKAVIFIAPKFCGRGLGLTGDIGIRKMKDSIKLKDVKYSISGDDILVEGRF